jgi:ribokinase
VSTEDHHDVAERNEVAGARMRCSVVVLGSLHLDILVRAPGRPMKGETLPGQDWAYKPGGKGGNQAVAAAQFGAEVSMIGRVGDDSFGNSLLTHLRDSNVNTQHVRVDREKRSGMSVAIIDAEGDYGAVIVSGANVNLSQEDVEAAESTIKRSRVLVLQNEIPDTTNLIAAEIAQHHGVRVVLNAAPSRPLDPHLAACLEFLVVNAIEAEMMCRVPVFNLPSAGEAAEKLSRQVANVIVTAGGMGLAIAKRGQEQRSYPAHTVKLVDTHGAGDAFIGAFVSQLAADASLYEATRFANAAASLFVSATADEKKLITRDKVANLLSRM